MIGGRTARTALVVFAIVIGLGAIGLILAARSDERSTAFSVDVLISGRPLALAKGDRVCQGPVRAQAAFRGVRLWLGDVPAPGAALAVRATSSEGVRLGSGRAAAAGPSPSPTVELDRTVPRGARFELCFVNEGPARVLLSVGGPSRSSGVLTRDGRPTGSAAAMVMLSPRPRSMLALVPTIFRRAALFRPSWIGAWTFWALLVALAGVVPVAALALRSAAREDAEA